MDLSKMEELELCPFSAGNSDDACDGEPFDDRACGVAFGVREETATEGERLFLAFTPGIAKILEEEANELSSCL